MTAATCAHPDGWTYLGPRHRRCRACLMVDVAPESLGLPRCRPYCALFDEPSMDPASETEFCPDCGTAWVIGDITEVTAPPECKPVRQTRAWVPA